MGEEGDVSRMSMTGEESVVISDVSSIPLGEDGVIVSCISILVEDMVDPQVKEDRDSTSTQNATATFWVLGNVDLAEMNIASS